MVKPVIVQCRKAHTGFILYRFNGLFSRTSWVSRCQKVETNLDLNEARDVVQYSPLESIKVSYWRLVRQFHAEICRLLSAARIFWWFACGVHSAKVVSVSSSEGFLVVCPS